MSPTRKAGNELTVFWGLCIRVLSDLEGQPEFCSQHAAAATHTGTPTEVFLFGEAEVSQFLLAEVVTLFIQVLSDLPVHGGERGMLTTNVSKHLDPES